MTTAQTKAEAFVVPVEWKAAGDDKNVLEGYASTFGNVDLQGDIIDPKAFNKTVQTINSKGIPFLLEHISTANNVLGTVFHAKPDAKGLKIKVRLSSAPSVQDLRVKMKEGHLNKMSIGYYPIKWSFKTIGDGQEVRVLEEVKLREVSVVAFPANTEASITRVKNEMGGLSQEDRVNVALELVKALLLPASGAAVAGEVDEPTTAEGAGEPTYAADSTPDEEKHDESDDGSADTEEKHDEGEDDASAYVMDFLGIGEGKGDNSYSEALADPDDLLTLQSVDQLYADLSARIKEKK